MPQKPNPEICVDTLSRWFHRQARALPWRENHNPYFIWISEVMLQQTQVATVIPYYNRFLTLFPTIQSLAEASEAAVLTAWSGLGYYSRAKNLKRGAEYLVRECNATFPRTREAILKVPGIGPYTAGAILSIAFDLREPLVDGNVQRVFSRFYGFDKPIASKEAHTFFWARADEWVKRCESPRVLNQGLMELGATVCTKGTPKCSVCPIHKGCIALRENRQTELPPKKIRPEKVELNWLSLVLESKGQIFLHKNKSGEWWSDMWDFPRIELKSTRDLPKTIQGLLQKMPRAQTWKELGHQTHTVTHHKIKVVPYLFRLPQPQGLAEKMEGSWYSLDGIGNIPVSSLVKKILRSHFDVPLE